MKKIALLLAIPSFAFALDYSRCPTPFEISIDADGKVSASDYYQTKSVKTEGRLTTMVIAPKKSNLGGMYGSISPSKIIIERDEQDRIIKITNGGEKPSEAEIAQWRNMFQNPGGYVGGSYGGGIVGGYGGGGYGMSISGGVSSGGGISGGAPSNVVVPDGKESLKSVDIKDITDKDLNALGLKDIKAEEVRTGSQEWARSAKTQNQLKQIYKQSAYQMPIMIPRGSSYSYNIVSGACIPSKIDSLNYSSASDKVESTSLYDVDSCSKVKAAWEKHREKIEECTDYDYEKVGSERTRLINEGVLNIAQNNPYMMGGLVGGGYGGGFGGGYPGGGMMGGFGSPAQTFQSYVMNCKMYENWQAMSNRFGPPSNAGSTGGATQK